MISIKACYDEQQKPTTVPAISIKYHQKMRISIAVTTMPLSDWCFCASDGYIDTDSIEIGADAIETQYSLLFYARCFGDLQTMLF